jgi:hypothetical protein
MRPNAPLPWLALAVLPYVLACPGRLENPARFEAALQSDAGPASDAGTACNVEGDLFIHSCGAGCHEPPSPQQGLDLVTAGVGTRLLSSASHCNGLPFISASNSYLVEKVGPTPPCGQTMPYGGAPLSAQDLACLEAYAASLWSQAGSP